MFDPSLTLTTDPREMELLQGMAVSNQLVAKAQQVRDTRVKGRDDELREVRHTDVAMCVWM